jgi:hypothetical protein
MYRKTLQTLPLYTFCSTRLLEESSCTLVLALLQTILLQQLWCLLRKTKPCSLQGGEPTSKHINCLGTSKNLVMGPNMASNNNNCSGKGQQQLTTAQDGGQ